MCEIPSPCFNAVFTGFLLDHRSLPPDFASRCVKSLALVLTRYLQAFCSITAHFRCEIPSPCFNAVFTGFLLDHSSLPPDFARFGRKILGLRALPSPPPHSPPSPSPSPPSPHPSPLLPPSPLAGAEGPPCSGREVWGWALPPP